MKASSPLFVIACALICILIISPVMKLDLLVSYDTLFVSCIVSFVGTFVCMAIEVK